MNETILVIPYGTIFLSILSFIGVYILLPILLIARNFIIIKIIERFILTEKLWLNVSVYETDRAYYNTLYAKRNSFKFKDNEVVYEIDGQVVSEKEYQRFKSASDFHYQRMAMLQPEISFKSNLLLWIVKYYKIEDFKNPIATRGGIIYEKKVDDIKIKNKIDS